MERGTLHVSSNYVWCEEDILDHGSMGRVFLGRHRTTGDKYAVKVFDEKLKMMQKDYIRTELDIIKRIPSHENVIKIIGVEVLKRSSNKVIIMEYCQGGSLQQILNRPENYFGLREEEFLLVFFHICKAVCHLHEKDIIHSDIKPGNILLGILPDDSHVYKLTDFGTAKCIKEDGGTLRIMANTEEYLHPDLHRDHFIEKKLTGSYDSHVDLWSFGVMIYYCATGQFPFVPCRGIKHDKHTMQILTRHKEPGVISQVERPDGSISSTKHLTTKCYLRSGTKETIESFLAILFDLARRINSREFFEKVHNFEMKTKIYTFDVRICLMFTLHLRGNARLSDVRKEVTRWTGIPTDKQLMLWDMTHLDGDCASETKPITEWLNTTEDRPLVILSSSDCFRYSDRRRSSQPPKTDLPDNNDDDSKWSKEICGIMHFIATTIRENVSRQENVLFTANLLRLQSSVRLKFNRYTYTDSERLLNALEFIEETLNSSIPINFGETLQSIRNDMQKINIQTLRHISSDTKVSTCQKSRCWHKAENIVTYSQMLYEAISDKSKSQSSHNNIEINKYNKSELRRNYRHMNNLLRQHCFIETRNLCDELEQPTRDYLSLIEAEEKIDVIKRSIHQLKNSITASAFLNTKPPRDPKGVRKRDEMLRTTKGNGTTHPSGGSHYVSLNDKMAQGSSSFREGCAIGCVDLVEKMKTITQDIDHLLKTNTAGLKQISFAVDYSPVF